MKTILYLGTDPEHFLENRKDCKLIHYPVIRIVPRKIGEEIEQAYRELPDYTHILFTSKNAVHVFFEHLFLLKYDKLQLYHKTFIAIGSATAHALKSHLRSPDLTAQHETQEGLIALLKQWRLESAYILLPRSSLSRPLLSAFLEREKVRYRAFNIYDTEVQKLNPIPDLNLVDEIVFTSPSTVRGFMYVFGNLPKDKHLCALGPITEKVLSNLKQSSN
jgi:uroporphyrinogen-III synthase